MSKIKETQINGYKETILEIDESQAKDIIRMFIEMHGLSILEDL